MVRIRINAESPTLRGLIVLFACLYLVRFIGVYRETGSVNEWLHLSQIGLTGGDHWGIYSQTYSLPTFARMIGVSTPEAWRTMVVMLGLVGFFLTLYTAHRLSTRVVDFALIVALLLFSPFARAALNGQADYDGLTLIATSFFLLSRHPAVAVVSGALMGITNPEQSATTLVCVSMLWVVIDRRNLKRSGIALISLFISTLAIRITLNDPDVTGRLPGYFTPNSSTGKSAYQGLTDFGRLLDYLPHLFAGAWVLMLALLVAAWRSSRFLGLTLLAIATIAIPSAALLSHNDGSRIFALVMGPTALVAVTSLLHGLRRKALVGMLAVAVGMQFLYIQQGSDEFEQRWPTMFENLESRPEPLD
jgi:hypothetical protein